MLTFIQYRKRLQQQDRAAGRQVPRTIADERKLYEKYTRAARPSAYKTNPLLG